MKQLEAAEFKVRFEAVLKSIESTGEPVLVTKNGKPHVKVILYRDVGENEPAPGRPSRRRKKRNGR